MEVGAGGSAIGQSQAIPHHRAGKLHLVGSSAPLGGPLVGAQ